MGFIKFLLIIIFVSVIFRIIFKWLIPMFFRSYVGKMTDNMRDSARSARSRADARQEGEVIIENNKPKQSGSDTPKKGEYIEYEEID